MTTLDLVLPVDEYDSLDELTALAHRAERAGFDRISAGETTGRDMVTTFAMLGDRTQDIGISTDVLSPFGRKPTVLAQTALTMHELTGGRFRLGLGTSSPAIAERWHGDAFETPLRRLRETIDVIRTVYDGGAVSYDGSVYELGGLSYERPVPDSPPPIDVAALGPKATELTGRFADGWVPQLFTPDGLLDRMSNLERGCQLGDRSIASIRVMPLVRCFAGDDAASARQSMRSTLAFLIGAYGPYYGNSVANQGYEAEVAAIRSAWEDRDTEAMTAALPEKLMDRLGAAGSPETVRNRVSQFADLPGVDGVRVGFVRGMEPADRRKTMAALEPLLD